jgi:1,4-dihydroxy-2-naphthoate octaprenyltransferase
MDLEPDRDAGRRTTAVVIGRVPAKVLIASILLAECALVFYVFHDATLGVFLLASGVWFMTDALLFWRGKPYSPAQMRLAMIAWNLIALCSMPWVWWKASLTVLR